METKLDNEEIGQRIKTARKEKGYTQEELAYAIGSDKATMSKTENGIYTISVKNLASISKELSITTNFILFGS